MFTTGLGPVANSVFSVTSFIIGVPTGIRYSTGSPPSGAVGHFTSAMLYSIAFIVTFLLGGITGIMVAISPFDQQVHDTYFVVAHFHYVMGGGALLTFIGAATAAAEDVGPDDERTPRQMDLLVPRARLPPHLLPAALRRPGHAAPHQTFEGGIGLDGWNLASSIGAGIMGIGLVLLLYNLINTLIRGPKAPADLGRPYP